jgi:hypothetical protein
MFLRALFMMGVGAVLALFTRNAQRTGEMKFRGLSPIVRQDSPDVFQFVLIARFVVAALMVAIGAWSYFRV